SSTTSVRLSAFSSRPFSRRISLQVPFSAKEAPRYIFSIRSGGASRNILIPSATKSPSSFLVLDFFNNCCIFFICPLDVLVIIILFPPQCFGNAAILRAAHGKILRCPLPGKWCCVPVARVQHGP